MAEPQEIAYRKSEWFEGARELIQRSELGTPNDLDWIENQIRSGHLLLYRVEREGGLIGIFTGYVDTLHNGRKELAIVHAVSVEQQEFSFIVALEPLISALARQSGFDLWRVNSKRVGLNKLLAKHGFKIEEIVFTKEV